jgi:hypothetical protein
MADLLESENMRLVQFYKVEWFFDNFLLYIYIYMNSYTIPVIYPLVQYMYMKFPEEFCCVGEGIR